MTPYTIVTIYILVIYEIAIINLTQRGVGEDVLETWILKVALQQHGIHPLVDRFLLSLGNTEQVQKKLAHREDA